MASISGILQVGEANATLRAIGARQRGAAYLYSAALVGSMIAGAILGKLVVDYLGESGPASDLGLFGGLIAGLLVYLIAGRRFTTWRFRTRLAKRGIPLDLPLSLELTPEAVVYKVGDVQTTAKWPAVTELFSSRGYWIFLAQASPLFAPKRFFPDTGSERDFVQTALGYMSDAARQRSSDAVELAEVS